MHLVRLLPGIVWVSAFALYALTAAPGIVNLFDDSLEFQVVGPTFGIAHPTGYPLYTLLSGIWSRVLFPFGNWAWRMNLFSAVAAATAVCLVFLLAQRLVTTVGGAPNRWAGITAALAFGLVPVWWQQATMAEVYALHGVFVAAILLLTIGINQTLHPDKANRSLASQQNSTQTVSLGAQAVIPDTSAVRLFDRRMFLLCGLIGLGLAHHRTTALLLPAVVFYLLWSVPGIWRPRRIWFGWGLALLSPLLLYLYLPIRATMGVHDLHGSYMNTWQGFWDHVLARGYVGFFEQNPLAIHRSLGDRWQLFRQQVGFAGLALGLLGLAWLVDRKGRPAKAWILVGLVFLSNLVFAVNYRVGDSQVYLLPCFLCLALYVGAGVGSLARLFARRRAVLVAVQLIPLAAIAFFPGGRGAAINRSHDWRIHDYAVMMASISFPPQSRVIGLEGEMTALKYMQRAAGLGLNATPVVADDPGQRRQAVKQSLKKGYPTYITREVADIGSQYSFSGAAPLVRVWPRGQAQPNSSGHLLSILFDDGRLRLEGYDLAIRKLPGEAWLQLVLYWRPLAPLTQVLKVSLRLQNADGNPILGTNGQPVVEDQFPLRQVALTNAWLPGELVRDDHLLPLPPQWASHSPRLLVIVYDADTLAEVGRWEVDLPE